jgi:transcriptional regulator with PAS, ATPase and Fis domain
VDRFVAHFNRLQGRSVTGVSREAMALLMAHDYPGNIRELENIIEHAYVLCPDGLIGPRHLPEELVARTPRVTPQRDLGQAVQTAERQAILDALKRNRFNRLAAAHELRMHKSTLFRKIKALGIDLPETDGRSGTPQA